MSHSTESSPKTSLSNILEKSLTRRAALGVIGAGVLAACTPEKSQPTEEPKPPVETETPTPAETETPVEPESPVETETLESPGYEELIEYLYKKEDKGGISHGDSLKKITEHFTIPRADIEIGNEAQIEEKLQQALELMLNGSPRSAQLVIDAENYAKENNMGTMSEPLAIEYLQKVSLDNAYAVIDGLAGEDWRLRDRKGVTQRTLDGLIEYGKRSIANWYTSGFYDLHNDQQRVLQDFYDNKPSPELFEIEVESRGTETRNASIDTIVESEFNIRAKNMQEEDAAYEDFRPDLFEQSGVRMGIEMYIDQAASDEAGYVAGRISHRDNYA